MLRTSLGLAGLVSLLGTAALAQSAGLSLIPLKSYTSVAPISLPPVPLSEANALRAAGFAKTAIDHRFENQDLTAAFGFLCGLQPRRNESIGSANGYDPQGRFIGAKLTRRF